MATGPTESGSAHSCDFNVVRDGDVTPKAALTGNFDDLAAHADLRVQRSLTSILFGGGTPIADGPGMQGQLIEDRGTHMPPAPDLEVTARGKSHRCQAEPGSRRFRRGRRLKACRSAAIRSDDASLRRLGPRNHDAAHNAHRKPRPPQQRPGRGDFRACRST